MKTYHIEKPDAFIQRIINASYPGYTGRKIKISIADSPLNCASYWSGGSRDYFTFVDLETMESRQAPQQSAFDKQVQGLDKVTLPDNCACVEHSIFCGKDLGLTIHIGPQNAAKLLPKPADISELETILLCATAQLKNTYSGRTNIRFSEARAKYNWITTEAWEKAKQALIEHKLLNKAGSITASGRNAISGKRINF